MSLWGWLLLAYLPVAALQPVWAHLVVRRIDRTKAGRARPRGAPVSGSALSVLPGRLSDRTGPAVGTISNRQPGSNCPPS